MAKSVANMRQKNYKKITKKLQKNYKKIIKNYNFFYHIYIALKI